MAGVVRLEGRTDRRQLLGGAIASAALALPGVTYSVSAQEGTAETQGPYEQVDAPTWAFVLHEFQDPYPGEIQAPAEPPAGTRYIASEVEIINDSDQALNVTPLDVRIRDEAGVEYRGGSALGQEPTINPRSLNPGELSRGWVWFIVPADSGLAEVVYVAPSPQFRVRLSS